MIKTIVGAVVLAFAFLLPWHGASAATADPLQQLAATLKPVSMQLISNVSASATKGKTYTSTKYKYSLVLPSTWKKITNPSGAVFAAQMIKDTNTEWILTMSSYKTQKQATAANSNLTKKPATFGQLLLTELQNTYTGSTCTLDSAKKKVIGTNNGARATITCTIEGTPITFSIFSFVYKLKYVSVTSLMLQSSYDAYLPQFDAITKTLKMKP